MDSVKSSQKGRKPKTLSTKRSLPPSPSSQVPQPSTSKKMKLKRIGNSDSAVKKLDPLLIPDVVKNISSYLVDVEDMKSIRSLNRLWRDECFERWRSTAVLVLTREVIQTLVKAYLRKNDPRVKITGNDELIQLFDKPFLNFRYPADSSGRIRAYPFRAMDIGGPSSIIWEQFFSKAKYLDLGDCCMKVEGFNWIFRTCPELKRLDLNAYDYHFLNIGNNREVENRVADVVSNLETLSIGESRAVGLMDHMAEFFGLEHEQLSMELNMANRNLLRNPFQDLFKMCPNLKNLWMQGNAMILLDTAQSEMHQFDSLALVPEDYNKFDDFCLRLLKDYVEGARPPLKDLVLWLETWRKCFPRSYEDKYLFEILNLVQGTLIKLELFINCEMEGIVKRPLNLASEGGIRTFSNLTHLKLSLDYRTFQGNLITFDFGSLREMKKLKEFRFEMGSGVAEGWVKKKLGIEDIQGKRKKNRKESSGLKHFQFSSNFISDDFKMEEVPSALKTLEVGKEGALEEILLPDLRLFHFHSNFTSEAIQFLGKVASNLQTLEVVLDEENFTTAVNTWLDLRQITLLPCSEVPKGLYSGVEGLKIVDNSKNYRRASIYWFNPEDPAKDYPIRKMKRVCKLTKPR